MKKVILSLVLVLGCATQEDEKEDENATCTTFYQGRKFISTSSCSGSYYLDSYNLVDKTYCFEDYPKSLCTNSVTCSPSSGGSPYSSYSRTQNSAKPSCASLGYGYKCSYGYAANASNCYP